MLEKKLKSIRKMSLLFLLGAAMIIPNAAWAAQDQEASALSGIEGELQEEEQGEETPEVTETPEVSVEPEETNTPTEETPGEEDPPQTTEVPEEAAVTEIPIDEVKLEERALTRAAKAPKKDTWVQASDGRWRYKYKDGTYAKKKWEYINGKWYYFASDSWMVTGWHKVSNKWYYYDSNGAMVTGWFVWKSDLYYLNQSGEAGVVGQMRTGWTTLGSNTYYFKSSGASARGFTSIKGKTYYFKKTGGKGTKGRMLTGWRTIGKKVYFFKRTGNKGIKGKMLTGWRTIDKQLFYFKKSGKSGVKGNLLLNWRKINNKWYYFETSGSYGAKGRPLTGIRTINGRQYYLNPSKTKGVCGRMETGWQTVNNKRYYFYSEGHMAKNTTINGVRLGADGIVVASSGGRTIKGFLQNAIKPVATTLYIWGGGHNDRVGGDARKYGLDPNWKKFYNQQPSTYNYQNFQYAYGKGLDCSGYVGWVAYNTVNTKSDQETCTTISTSTPKMYSNRGWGSYKFTAAGSFAVGDVVSKNGHVWIVLGQCSDKSLVIVHSTPQAGVQIAGTPNKDKSNNSQAVKLAKSYMKKYYGKFVSKFHLSSTTDISYLYGPAAQGGLNRFRWDITGKKMLSDPDGYAKMKPDQILKDLFNE